MDSSGRKTKDSLTASSEEELKASLREKGLRPLSIKAGEAKENSFFERISVKDLLTFTQELGNLLDSGLPIDRALYVLSEHSEKKAMKSVVREVYIDIQKGNTLSYAMGRHKIFPSCLYQHDKSRRIRRHP